MVKKLKMKNKNIIFMINVNLDNTRNLPYQYSIKSWKYWAEKNNCELFIMDKPLMDISIMKLTWQRYYLFEMLDQNNIEYDKILMVDADTIVHPNCPNFFDLVKDNEYGAVMNDGDYEWVLRSIREWKQELFQNERYVLPSEYINGGFQIVNKTHIPFFNHVKQFYSDNLNEIIKSAKKIRAGTDQTCINFLLKKHKINVKLLSNVFNLQDLFRKNLIYTPRYSWWDDEYLYTKAGWVYHFNAIPNNNNADKTLKYMKECYEYLYGKE